MKKLMAILIAMTLILSCFCMANAEEKTTLSVWHRWAGNNEAMLLEVCDAFEAAYPEYDIEVVGKAGEYFELLQSMIAEAAAGGALPDIFVGGYAMLNYISLEMEPATIDMLAPSQEAYDEICGRFTDNIRGVAAYDGVQVGLPYALSTPVMWVNMDIWAEAGLTEEDIPTTYEDLMACAEKIVANTDKQGVALQTNDNWMIQALTLSHSGSILSDDMTRVSFTNDATVGAMTWWQDMHKKGLSPKITYTEMATAFYSGELAVYCTSIMSESTFKDHCDFSWKAWPMPTFEGHEKHLPVGGSALISFTTDKEKYDDVWTLIDFMTGEEAMAIWTKTGYVCPTDAPVTATSNQEVAYEQLAIASNYVPWPGGSIGLEIDAMWASTRNEILWEDVDVVETLTALEEECNMLLDNA